MDYSELIEAIDRNERSKANTLLKQLTPRLKRFLRIHMNADRHDAEDCVQQTFIKVIEAINEGQIRNKERIMSFLLSTCRNTYLNHVKKNKRHTYDEYMQEQTQKPRQLLDMLDEERRRLLQWCIDQLNDTYRSFVEFWFNHPDSDAEAAATHFDISVSNAWTRKHRAIQKLSDCYEKKSEI